MTESITVRKTSRGFLIGEFEDCYQQKCTIQESSSLEDRIWLGVVNTGPRLAGPRGKTNEDVCGRMHLGIGDVRRLLPILTYFAEHGVLCEYPGSPPPEQDGSAEA